VGVGVPANVTVAVSACAVVMLEEDRETVTAGVDLAWVTVTVAEPDFVVSCVDVAVMVAVPAPAGVKTPALLTVPMLAGLTDQVTELLKLPVPVSVAAQVDV